MEKKNVLSRFLRRRSSGTSSNVEELAGRLLSVVRDLPLCGKTPWKLREVERLLAQGAPITVLSPYENFTLLHTACLNKDLATAEFLIRQGINVNAVDSYNSSPMHIAVGNSSSPVNAALIRLLHQNGANLNATNKTKETPLHLAVMQEDTSCARTLISLGADFYMCSRSNILIDASPANRALVYAVRSGRLGSILLLLQNGDSFEDFSARSLLSYGYSRCIHFKIIELFVEAGLKVPTDFFITYTEDFCCWPDSLKEWMCNPLPLQLLCMKTIRHCLSRHNVERVSELHLPSKIKRRLMYGIESFDLDLKLKPGTKDRPEKCFSFNIYGHKKLYV